MDTMKIVSRKSSITGSEGATAWIPDEESATAEEEAGGGDGDGGAAGSGTGQSPSSSKAPNVPPHPWQEIDIGMFGEKCCVLRFKYPDSHEFIQRPGEHEGWTKDPRGKILKFIGLQFTGVAVYDEKGMCSCSCCEFKQFVKVKAVFRSAKGLVNIDFPYTEDCSAVGPGGGHTPVAWRDPPEIVDTPREEMFCFGMPDVGDELPPRDPDPEEDAKNVAEADFVNRFSDGGCRFFMKDTPGIHTYPNVPFFIEYYFKGEIRDTCRGDALKRRSIFTYWLGGYISPSGEYVALPATGIGPGVPASPPTVYEADPQGKKTGTVSPTGEVTTMPPIPPRRP